MDDLISRSALLEKMSELNGWDEYNEGVGACHRLVDFAPAVDAESVRYGRWIDCEPVYTNSGVKHNAKECSECGQRGFIDTEYGMYESDFCPNCGAKMDGERRDGDSK